MVTRLPDRLSTLEQENALLRLCLQSVSNPIAVKEFLCRGCNYPDTSTNR